MSLEYSSTLRLQLQISTRVIAYVPFMNFNIKIYEELTATNPKKYFCSPLCLLDKNSVKSCSNEVSKQAEVRFNVIFFTQELKLQIVKYLKNVVGEDVKETQILVKILVLLR